MTSTQDNQPQSVYILIDLLTRSQCLRILADDLATDTELSNNTLRAMVQARLNGGVLLKTQLARIISGAPDEN